MNKLRILLSAILVLGLVTMCREDNPDFIDIDAIPKGAYSRVVSVDVSTFDLFDLSNTEFVITLEEVDAENGGLFASYDFYGTYVDNNPGNGTIPPQEVLIVSIPGSTFTINAESGVPRAQISISATDALNALNVDPLDVGPGDGIQTREELVLTDGRKFGGSNSSGDVVGGAFFANTYQRLISFVCPIDPALYVGSYDGLTTGAAGTGDGFPCPPAVVTYICWDGTAVVTFTEVGNGVYGMSDVAGGIHSQYWSAFGHGAQPGTYRNVCGSEAIDDAFNEWGEHIVFSNVVRAGNGVITYDWVNISYPDFGSTVLTPQ